METATHKDELTGESCEVRTSDRLEESKLIEVVKAGDNTSYYPEKASVLGTDGKDTPRFTKLK